MAARSPFRRIISQLVAAVVPMKGIDAETLALSTSRKFLAILRRSYRELEAGRAIPLAENRRRLK